MLWSADGGVEIACSDDWLDGEKAERSSWSVWALTGGSGGFVVFRYFNARSVSLSVAFA